MDELAGRLTGTLGLREDQAEGAIAILVGFLAREAPSAAMARIADHVPGVAAILAAPPLEPPSRHFGRHFGGMAGLMDVANRMMALGLTMSDVQAVVRETVAFARARAGDEAVDEIVTAVPGLRQVV